MNVNIWQIFCFLAVIIGSTIVVFPTGRTMLPYLIDNGRYDLAGVTTDSLLKEAPQDAAVVEEAVRLDLLEGLPDRAIGRLEALHGQSPLDTRKLEKLALLYEWRRKPAKARATWERLLENAPQDETALTRLIGYYRYAGDVEKEGAAIIRLIRRKRIAGEWKDNGNRLIDLIATELDQLGQNAASKPVSPLTAMLIDGLYQIYGKGLDDPTIEAWPDDTISDPLMIRCLEQFVWTGHLDRGEAFAAKADRLWHSDIGQRMLMVDALRWNQMNREALDLLERLHELAPEDRHVLLAMAETAAAAPDPASGIAAYKALVQLEPDEPLHRQHLMALYRQSGHTASLFDEYRRQFDATADAHLVPKLLDLAMESGDPRLKEAALSLAAQEDANDSAVLHQRVALYLTLNQPDQAYPLLKRIAVTAPLHTTADLLAMIRVAGYTNDPAVLADALTVAEKQGPDDLELLSKIADHWLAAARPEKAYATMRRLTSFKGNRVADILRTLEMAGHTGDAHLINEAVAWAIPLAAHDPAVSEAAATLYLASGQTERAYEREAMRVRRRRETDRVPALVALAESTGRPDLLVDALHIGIELTPDDAGLSFRLARLHMAQGEEIRAIGAFERYLQLRPDDRGAQDQLAKLYEWQNQPLKALAIYRRLARSHPEDATLSAALARLMAETGDREGMLKMAIQFADTDPQDTDLALAAGRALVADGRLEKGRVYLERAATLAPQRKDIWQELASVYEWTGQTDRLIVALGHLVDADLLDRRQSILLAEAYLSQHRGNDAVLLLQAIEKEAALPRREGLMLAEAHELGGRPEAARRLYNRLFDENRNDPVFIADLGNRVRWRQHWDLALTFYAATLLKDPHNLVALKGSGQIHAWNNNRKRAIAALETYNRLYPRDYETQYLLGELYFAVHREADAQKQFRKAMKLINSGKMRTKTTGVRSPGKQAQP